jgi:hypothetical protein
MMNDQISRKLNTVVQAAMMVAAALPGVAWMVAFQMMLEPPGMPVGQTQDNMLMQGQLCLEVCKVHFHARQRLNCDPGQALAHSSTHG